MNLKNHNYMEGEEFKSRQSRFGFVYVKAFEFVKQFAAECRKGWFELFHPKQKTVNKSLPLPFDRPLTHWEWSQQALQACINAETA
ncbi:MAG: hypothetical protein HZC43_02270 [Nitrosomonadales bacterium]|nr:hypothetical protein [Nitrosomonadales bacterium]